MTTTGKIKKSSLPRISLDDCPRCGGEHHDLPLFPFTRPVETPSGDTFRDFATCPTTKEPILIGPRWGSDKHFAVAGDKP